MTMEDFRTKLIYTAVVYFLFLQLALRYGICGPSLSDLRDNLRVSTDDVSKSVSVMCVGICIGAISSGFLCKWICRELVSFVLILATAAFVATITFFEQYALFVTWNLLVGITSGAAISLCESWILEIWGKQCGPYMQALQFFRGMGYIIAPVLADPFLSGHGEVMAVQQNVTMSLNGTEWADMSESSSSGNVTAKVHERILNTRIRTPYLLNAVMLAVGAAFLAGLYLFKLIREKQSHDCIAKGISREEIISKSNDSIFEPKSEEVVVEHDKTTHEKAVVVNSRARFFGYLIILLSSVFYLFFYEEVVVIFLPTFATKLPLHLSTSEASLLSTAFSLANVAGKAVGVLLALKISHIVILYMNLSIMIGSLVMIILYANSSVTILWVGVCLHGIGLSSIIASLYTLMENTIEMSASICGILNMMGTMGSVIMPLVIGRHLDTFPMALMYACLVCASLCLVLFVVMHLLLINKNKLIAIPVCEKAEKRGATKRGKCST